MSEKVILVLVDGMRPDGFLQCGNPFAQKLVSLSSHALDAQTVFPSVTLPCHMSLFHSVDPDRHGILTNTYVPQVRPIVGLIDQLDMFGKKCAFFNTWEELRDLCRPDHLHTYYVINQHKETDTDTKITDATISYVKAQKPDFLFLYLGETDEEGGHDTGWMSETYLKVVNNAVGCIERLYEEFGDEYTIVVTADHGGHERRHGERIPEDMTIPILFVGKQFPADTAIEGVSIKDIAPTITKLLEVPPVKEWEGTPRV